MSQQPQQPELRRSGRGRVTQDGKRAADELDQAGSKGGGGPVPEENQPGHHPDEEQDKPQTPPD